MLLCLATKKHIKQKKWKEAANGACNLGELLQLCGELDKAVKLTRRSVQLADKSHDVFKRLRNRAMLAAALHANGLQAEAAMQFEEAERIQKKWQPAYPLIYSPGFYYCDLLLAQGWDTDVQQRAEKALQIATRNHWLLNIALDHLSLGRAHLLAIQRNAAGDRAQAAFHFKQAVDGFRRGGQQGELPLGLLARAALHIHTGDFAAARHDLDDTLTLSVRCGFRLHEADAHLGLARLALAENTLAPAREHLATARRIVRETGYHRRDGELTALDAEAAARSEPGATR